MHHYGMDKMTQHFITRVIEAYASGMNKTELWFCADIYKDSKDKGNEVFAQYFDKFKNPEPDEFSLDLDILKLTN